MSSEIYAGNTWDNCGDDVHVYANTDTCIVKIVANRGSIVLDVDQAADLIDLIQDAIDTTVALSGKEWPMYTGPVANDG